MARDMSGRTLHDLAASALILQMSMRDDEALVTIAVFDTRFEAGLARGALEAIGIRALVPEERLFRSGALPGNWLAARLQVLESDRDRALAELRRVQIHLVPPPSASDA
jgi:hypothetical protein